MKKIYTYLILILFLLSFFIGINIYSFYSTSFAITNRKSDATVVNIYANSNFEFGNVVTLTKKSFYNELKDAADKANLNIYKVSYPSSNLKEKKKIVVYAYINDEEDFYKNIPLKNGRFINKNDSENTYVSSLKNDDPNCVGIIKWFDQSVILEIRPIDSNQNDLMYEKYVVNTTNLSKFKEALKSEQVSLAADATSSGTELIAIDNNGLYYFYIVSAVSLLALAIVFCCILICCIYTLVYRYKEYAVKKMFGIDNTKLIFKFWFEMVKSYFLIGFISCLGLILFLYFYNNWAHLKTFLSIIITVNLIIFIIFCLILFILSLIVLLVDMKLMLKNKKPLLGLSLLNNVTKIIFCIVIYLFCVLLFNNILQVKNEITSLKRWEFTKNYAFGVFDFQPPQNYSEEEYWNSVDLFRTKAYKFYLDTNKNNNLLFRPTDALISESTKKHYENEHRPEWSYEMNSVIINNNYLKINHIYDENNKLIDLSSYEDKYVMTILVPEKYKSVEKELKSSYQKYCDFRSEFTKHKLSLNLIYVKNNQKYFSINPLLGAQINFEFVDPIAIVINNCSIAPDSASSYMTQGYYYFYINNPNNPYESLQNTIQKFDMTSNFITISSLYNFVGKTFYSTQQLMKIYILLLVVSLIPFLVVSFATITNYIERKKQILSAQFINGYSFYKSHYGLFLKTLITWLTIYTIERLIFAHKYGMITAIILLILDLIIQYFVLKSIKIYKIKDVFKGV